MATPHRRFTATTTALVTTVLIAVCAGHAQAQTETRHSTTSLAGVWRGTSLCTSDAGPACHNEVVVYHLRAVGRTAAHGEHLEWLANKIVNGAEEEMGTLMCDYAQRTAVATCPMRDWSWRFTVSGDTLDGTLTEAKGKVWRHVHVVRSGG